MNSTKWENEMDVRNKMTLPIMREASGTGGRKILVVDDNEIVLHVISCIMRRADYKITTARSGVAALDALRQQDFELLITDLVMPVMDGITLLKKAKALYPNLRAIILTGSPHRVPQPIERINADALLAKPFYQDDLLAHVAHCLNRHHPKESDIRRLV